MPQVVNLLDINTIARMEATFSLDNWRCVNCGATGDSGEELLADSSGYSRCPKCCSDEIGDAVPYNKIVDANEVWWKEFVKEVKVIFNMDEVDVLDLKNFYIECHDDGETIDELIMRLEEKYSLVRVGN